MPEILSLRTNSTAVQGSLVVAVATVLVFLYANNRRKNRNDLAGPKPKSFWFGNLPELFDGEFGEVESKWAAEFGAAYRLTAPFEGAIAFSDPAAIHHIFSSPNYIRPEMLRPLTKVMTGPGLLWAQGEDHKRQRRVMQPAFGLGELRALVPLFTAAAHRLGEHWRAEVEKTEGGSVINVSEWLARATLDIIGDAAFDYPFGAIEDSENELSKAYQSLFADTARPSNNFIALTNVFKLIPDFLITALVNYSRNPVLVKLRSVGNLATRVSRDLAERKMQAYVAGQGGKDIFSLLVKANLSNDARSKMSTDELLASMSTLTLAGHETTANSVTWSLWILAQRPDVQTRLREEIMAARERALAERGDAELSYADFENMTYFSATIKEILRFSPVIRFLRRQPVEDDIVPLTWPVKTQVGDTIHQVQVRKGETLVISVYTYNTSKALWGEDADTFRPERWIDQERKNSGIGLYSNLMTFGMGVRGCIGWRFSLIEMQCLLAELLSTFKFSIPDGQPRVRREGGQVMVPVLEGQREKGKQMPLLVELTSN